MNQDEIIKNKKKIIELKSSTIEYQDISINSQESIIKNLKSSIKDNNIDKGSLINIHSVILIAFIAGCGYLYWCIKQKGLFHPSNALQTYLNDTISRYRKLREEFDGTNVEFPAELQCPILMDIPEKPVLVGGKLFDYDSIQRIPQDILGRRIHPLSKEYFYTIEIQPAYDQLEKIKNIMEKQSNKKVSRNDAQRP